MIASLSRHPLSSGHSSPLGATVVPGGVNFSIYSRHATAIDLLFFDREEDRQPSRVISLDPDINRTYYYWHVFVPDVDHWQIYGYRAHGVFEPSAGLRFDPTKLLLDPYGRAIAVPPTYNRKAAELPGDNAGTAMKSVVVDTGIYDWEGDTPLHLPASRTVIYEMHVRGFTRHPSSGVSEARRGTYAGLVEKIPYLKQLGITAVELMPVFQFDIEDAPLGRINYWGYAPVSFFAPHRGYSSRQDPLGPVNEFRDMVKALHRAGIEVILDVVFNHTTEDDHEGPTLSFRGLDNPTYYILQSDPSRYADYSGTGNTLNTNHPIVRRMILDSLRYWVSEMHVDGFRFDLASILGRDQSGAIMASPPVLWDIESHPALAGAKLIAEAWNAAGLYQVGTFVGDSWREWNGRFRDDVRSFFRCDRDTVPALADRLIGSPAMYGHKQREAEQSINFVTCHDGFTLNDLVSYSQKHNEANGENNNDGAGDNRSSNWGVEGPTSDPAIETLRNRQVKNLFTVTVLSLGIPMLLMGDEVRRTQQGNNNAYCQDNLLSWFDWDLAAKHADVLRFVSMLSTHRHIEDLEPVENHLTLTDLLTRTAPTWHGIKLGQPDWGPDSHSLAVSVADRSHKPRLYLILNAYWEPLDFELPPSTDEPWRRWIDTSLDSPNDIVDWDHAPTVATTTYRAAPHTVIALVVHPPAP